MARQGRFGRSTSGQQNLSSFIFSLAQQSRNLEQSALLNAYYDSSPYGGGVPGYGDIEEWVQSRLGEGELGDAERSYYLNILKQARDFKIKQQYEALSASYAASQGANFDEYIGFLKGAGSEKYGTMIPTVVNEYLNYAYEDMVRGQMTEEEYDIVTQSALAATIEDPITYEDIKYNANVNLYEYQKVGIGNIVQRAEGKKLEKVIAANKQLAAWYQGWLDKLTVDGMSNNLFYDNVRTYLVNVKTQIRADEKQLAAQQAAAFLAARKASYDSSLATLNAFAKQIGSYLGVDTTDPMFSFADLQKENPAGLTAWLGTQSVETRSIVERALNETALASRAYISALNSQGKGNTTEALVAAGTITMTKKVSGENTSYDEYVTGSARKAELMAAAGGIPGNEKIVMENWVKFLRGEDTKMFGEGLIRTDNKYLQDLQTKIDNEASMYEAALQGKNITQIPATLIDEVFPSLVLSGFYPSGAEEGTGGDNKYTLKEFGNALTTFEYDQGLKEGTLQIQYSKDPLQDPAIVPISSPAPGAGVVTRLQQDANGNNYAAQYQGVPIYGSNAGQPDTKYGLWGYQIQTPNGVLYTDVNGTIYKNPPIDVNKLMLAADGSGILSRDSTTISSGPEKQYKLKSGYEAEEASINDLVDPSALQKAQAAMVNPYARVNEDNPMFVNLQATNAIVQAIVDTVPPSSRVAQEGIATLDTTVKAQTQLANMASISQDSGVRVSMMNAQTAIQKAQAKKEEMAQLAVLKPRTSPPQYGQTYLSNVQTQQQKPQAQVSYYNNIPREETVAEQPAGQQQPVFDLSYIFRGLQTIANPVAGLASTVGLVSKAFSMASSNQQSAPAYPYSPALRPSTGSGSGSGVSPATSITGGPVGGASISFLPSGIMSASSQAAQNAFRAGERAPLNISSISPAGTINAGPRIGQPVGGGL